MHYAADFRRAARDSLRGKWGTAVIVGLVAAILGATGNKGPEVNFHFDGSGARADLEYAGRTLFSTAGGMDSDIMAFVMGGILYILAAAIIMGVIYFILGSVVATGYARFNLELTDGLAPSFDKLFSYFPYWKTTALARLLRSVYVLLWSLLFIIPGIVASYSYTMTDFILAENPHMTAGEAIGISKQMMSGNRFRLFCLELSFIGWGILASLTFGIGNLWLTPYQQAAKAAFYHELSGSSRFYGNYDANPAY